MAQRIARALPTLTRSHQQVAKYVLAHPLQVATMPIDELVRRFLRATRDTRRVVPDVHARYYGAVLDDQSLTPGQHPRLGAIRFEDWLTRSMAEAGR